MKTWSIAHLATVAASFQDADSQLRIAAAAAEDGPAMVAVTVRDDAPDSRPDIVWSNPAARALLGPDGADAQDVLSAELVFGAAAPQAPQHWLDVVAELARDGDEEWHTAALAQPLLLGRQVRVRVTPVPQSSLLLVWFRPVTEEAAAAEEAMADAEYRFKVLSESAPIGIVVSDAGVRLAYVNAAFAAISGLERDALSGTGWLSTVSPEDLPVLTAAVNEVLTGADADLTVRMHSVDAGIRWVRLRLTPVVTRTRAAGFVGTAEDITARRERESQLSYQASHDTLTGLANRRRLMEVLTDDYQSARRQDRDIAVLFCDLDGFKNINDQHGHDAGDRVLIEVANRLSATARDSDIVARLAGDEFVVVLRHIGCMAEAEAAARRQLSALTRPIHIGQEPVTLAASIGIAVRGDHESASALLRAADERMYNAKRNGGGLATGRVTTGGPA